MKKMFFTAMALVAFSSTSMANTIEVKEVVIPVEEKVEVEVLKTSCEELAQIVFEFWISAGYTEGQAAFRAYRIEVACR